MSSRDFDEPQGITIGTSNLFPNMAETAIVGGELGNYTIYTSYKTPVLMVGAFNKKPETVTFGKKYNEERTQDFGLVGPYQQWYRSADYMPRHVGGGVSNTTQRHISKIMSLYNIHGDKEGTPAPTVQDIPIIKQEELKQIYMSNLKPVQGSGLFG